MIQTCFNLRGNKSDILEWLAHQPKLRLAVIIRNHDGKEPELGYSWVPLSNVLVEPADKLHQELVPFRSFPVYDCKNRLVLQSKTSIASLNVQSGLLPNWVNNGDAPLFERLEFFDNKSSSAKNNAHMTSPAAVG
jgi:hypothetical protein